MDEPRGRVLDWSSTVARADGLAGVALGDRVEIEGAGPAFVTALAEDHVELAPLSPAPSARGALAIGAGPLSVAIGDDLTGRPIDALGRPHDGRASAEGPSHRLFFPPAGLRPEFERRRLTTGLWVFDFKQVIRRGSSILAAGDAPPVARHVLRHQAAEGAVSIHALLASDRSIPPMGAASILLEPGPDATPGAAWLIPWAAMATAAHFRKQGRDAVVVLDSLDRWHACADAFPGMGSWQTQLGRLLAHASSDARGSATLLALASPSLARSAEPMFDETLDFQRALRGSPIVDGSKLVRPPFKVHGLAPIGAALAILAELEDSETRQPGSLKGPAGLRLREALRFRPGMSPDLVEQLAAFVAVTERTDLSPAAVPAFIDSFIIRLRTDPSGRLAAIRERREVREEDLRSWAALARLESV